MPDFFNCYVWFLKSKRDDLKETVYFKYDWKYSISNKISVQENESDYVCCDGTLIILHVSWIKFKVLFYL